VVDCYHATYGEPEQFTPEEESSFETAVNRFRGAVISALNAKYIDSYIPHTTAKELWDALDDKFGVSHAGSELYLMEQLYDYKMVEDHSMVKELEQFLCVLPDKFVAGGIIAKLPPSWKDFSTSLKHKRKQFGMDDLIRTLDVEERAREKDTHGTGVESSSANAIQKKIFNFNAPHNNIKEKKEKPKQTTNFKKKKGKE
jgi:hypothetical protein